MKFSSFAILAILGQALSEAIPAPAPQTTELKPKYMPRIIKRQIVPVTGFSNTTAPDTTTAITSRDTTSNVLDTLSDVNSVVNSVVSDVSSAVVAATTDATDPGTTTAAAAAATPAADTVVGGLVTTATSAVNGAAHDCHFRCWTSCNHRGVGCQ